MEQLFIKQIQIKEVRHLKNITIDIDDQERKHLILTGKNGSGKTSVLEALERHINGLLDDLIEKKQQLKSVTRESYMDKELHDDKVRKAYQVIEDMIQVLVGFTVQSTIFRLQYQKNNFLFKKFNSKRNLKLDAPSGFRKIEREELDSSKKQNQYFLQHIVNLKAEQSFALNDGDEEAVQEINVWFERFEGFLKQIFEDKDLELVFDRKQFSFNIKLGNGQIVDFNTLSDGYSAILDIVTELIMRIEAKGGKSYNMQGIVLIDEVETHLHIQLQKAILPFLTSFFPNIQFIVTTHSPFVLSSIENAVVFDLEKQLRVEDLSAYAIDGIVESYFDNDKYSNKIKKDVERYAELLNKAERTPEEDDEFFNLQYALEKIPEALAPELKTRFLMLKNQKMP